MTKFRAGAVVLCAACALLAGCSSSSPQQAAAAVNPVAVLRKITGCAIPAGTAVGNQVGAVRYASCQVPNPDPASADGDQITVYASPDASALDAEMQTQGGVSTDSTKIVAGAGFFLTDTGVIDINNGGATKFYLDPAQVAQYVHGRLI